MPGLFGGIGIPEKVLDALESQVLSHWPDAFIERTKRGMLAAHAFGDTQPLIKLGEREMIALDGEWSLYREVSEKLLKEPARVSRVHEGCLDPDLESAGNLALLNLQNGTAHLSVDLTGTFPLYFAPLGEGLVFSSLLRPLAHVTQAAQNDYAMLEFLRQAYTVGSKTVFEGIQRLLPGQSLHFSASQGVKVVERSDAWAGATEVALNTVASTAWDRLLASINRGTPDSGGALMMSGGWDSRTLLAGIGNLSKKVHCYSHGDVRSRELSIARKLASASGMAHSLEPIDGRVLDRALLETGFSRTENLVFPHWHRAGRLLAMRGVQTVSAGVFGEILGGHYGPAMLSTSAGKLTAIGTALLGLKGRGRLGKMRSPIDYLRVGKLGSHWYLKPEYESQMKCVQDRMNADIESDLIRLKARGIKDDITLVEAFVSEHRGVQRINAQLLSCRAYTDISIPFGGREIFGFSTRTPLNAKVHNLLNRRMLETQSSGLLKLPMAATLLPAGWPLFAQETSRLVRKLYEQARLSAYQASNGHVPRPRLGWVNFDFLAAGSALDNLVDSLQCDFWDRAEMKRVVRKAFGEKDLGTFHPVYDQFTKILTMDKLLAPVRQGAYGERTKASSASVEPV